ncbi:MAG: Mut7-C RNAse domain-containing protein [Pseudomonadota bacterium]
MCEHCAEFRFYEELNDFLPEERRKRAFEYRFNGNPGIKDPVEALGVPHTEVDLILANGESVGFDYRLQDGDRIAVYPMFESLDITPIAKLRDTPLRRSAFVLDVHLGKLTKLLRLLGFDAKYRNDFHDAEIVDISVRENRIILTRDRRLLYAKVITHGYWLRSMDPEEQLREVIRRFDLTAHIRPFHRCLMCNGRISQVAKEEVVDLLEPLTRLYYDDFFRCLECGKIYWRGSHFDHMTESLLEFLPDSDP